MNRKTIAAIVATFAFAGGFALADSGAPKTYLLAKCPVSGDKLGELGKPVKTSYEGIDVYVCSKSCAKRFNRDPERFVKIA